MSTAAIPVNVGLVDQTGKISASELADLAGALNSQIHNDFAPIWKVSASVTAYPNGSVPSHTWQVIIQDQLDDPGALGYHTDQNNQPIAYVEFTNETSVTISHELVEMLGDPFGNRMTTAALPQGVNPSQVGITGRHVVSYLVELADPPENFSYPIAGIDVSDFLLPAWYRSAPVHGSQYSHAGNCTAPRQVLDGGYVSFANAQGEWYQLFNERGNLQVQDLGRFDKTAFGSLREWVDFKAREYRS